MVGTNYSTLYVVLVAHVRACCTSFGVKPVTKRLFSHGRRNRRLSASAGTRRAGYVLELHAGRTHHPMVRAAGMHHLCGDEVPGPGAHRKSAPSAHLSSSTGRVMHSSVCGRISMLHGTGPSQRDLAAVPDGLGCAIRTP